MIKKQEKLLNMLRIAIKPAFTIALSEADSMSIFVAISIPRQCLIVEVKGATLTERF